MCPPSCYIVAPQASLPGTIVAEQRESFKEKKYAILSEQSRLLFHPVSVETLGGVGPASRKFLQELGQRIAENTGEKRSMQFLRQRLGIAIQIGNAVSIINSTVDQSYDIED